ncbi:MAG: CHASE2 domain-containing protein [Geminocystis sp. GBBB08]|nr:CHASE2 domain-containing protein [Geminocystis sp. GBBB08]
MYQTAEFRDQDGTAPPPELEKKSLSLASLLKDIDSESIPIIRRQLLFQEGETTKKFPCTIQNSSNYYQYTLGYQLFKTYLKQQEIEINDCILPLQIKNKVFNRLEQNVGGYHNLDAGGYQIMINYLGQNDDTIQSKSITDVLNHPEFAPEYSHKVILIGYDFDVDSNLKKDDVFQTPYGKMRGVFIHAQMVNQLLSAVLDDRPLIIASPQYLSIIWIAVCVTLGNIFLYSLKQILRNSFVTLIPFFCFVFVPVFSVGFPLFSGYVSLVVFSVWIPMVAPIVGLVISSGLFVVYNVIEEAGQNE